MSIKKIKSRIAESIETKQKMLAAESFLQKIEAAADLLIAAFRADKKALFCGNGGSAADAQHLAAELSGRFYKNRKALFAEALSVNSSFLTAAANDFGFEKIFARMVEAAGREGDVLVAISTSGNSPNVLLAIEKAREQGMKIIALTGATGGKIGASGLADILLNAPSGDTPRIQEAHILIGHIICEIVESELFD